MHNTAPNRPYQILSYNLINHLLQRFNVALTRAKAKAIVIGNPLCLERDVKWRTYINKCREFGTHFGFDSQLHQADEIQKDIVEKITPILKNLKLNKAKA